MDDFLDELSNAIHDMSIYHMRGDTESFKNSGDEASGLIDSLGKNARRMLEIGILQDELAALGFSFNFSIDTMEVDNVLVEFYKDEIIVFGEDSRNIFNRGLPTWQQEVLNKVKELINDK